MKTLINPADEWKMNWAAGRTEWGTVKCPPALNCAYESVQEQEGIRERFVFTNHTGKPVFTALQDISIYVTFPDNYESAAVCMTNRCHAHIWCGNEVSYCMALRMGGDAPHLGLALTKGGLAGYSIERNPEKSSNDRGDFLLHPAPFALEPGESYELEWFLFWHNGKEDFYSKLKKYSDTILVKTDNFTYFQGETMKITLEPGFAFTGDQVRVSWKRGREEKEASFSCEDGKILLEETADKTGEWTLLIRVGKVHTFARFLIKQPAEKLADLRCGFLVEKQQYHKKGSPLDGAFLIYDNEEEHIYYGENYDHDGGRERIGMGNLLAACLNRFGENLDAEHYRKYKESLLAYEAYVERELFDTVTGEVFNDIKKDNKLKRPYNNPWVSIFFLEMYELEKDKKYAEYAYKAMRSFYENGGVHFYAIEIPVVRLMHILKKEGMQDAYEEMEDWFEKHAQFIAQTGVNYPAHEVNYEQSIVAPAANLLLQMYLFTKDERYLEAGEKQVGILELFNGGQPDYHLYETAIRHWDGYWFGKNEMYGDTFPHYWSALTGNVFRLYAQASGKEEYLRRAEASFRGTLSLFGEDGSASCANVYPVSVNGKKCLGLDPWANDQDWALYFLSVSREAD